MGGDSRKLSGFSEFVFVSVPQGDAVAFWKKLRKNFCLEDYFVVLLILFSEYCKVSSIITVHQALIL